MAVQDDSCSRRSYVGDEQVVVVHLAEGPLVQMQQQEQAGDTGQDGHAAALESAAMDHTGNGDAPAAGAGSEAGIAMLIRVGLQLALRQLHSGEWSASLDASFCIFFMLDA